MMALIRYRSGTDPFRQNGRKAREKPRMTKAEVRGWLKDLFNITDELSVEVVWKHMNELWDQEGEC
jgi:hypothetical protein